MPLTPEHLPLLRATRALIDSGEFIFICNAASDAAYKLGDRWLAYDLIEVINDGLAGVVYQSSRTLEAWLGHQLRIHWGQLSTNTMCMARLAWLDRLIDNLENNHASADV